MDGEPTFTETKEILDFVPDRVGHFLYFNNDIYDEIIKKKVPIETCPTSNFKCMELNDMKDHPFKYFFYKNHPLNINTDDTGVLDTQIIIEFIYKFMQYGF
ncbi:hypothetical protein IMG5_017660 [Ichthyophthirius multifiliis]|uniref:Adenosine deaminase domain-containing protein n=1 Tax=Ichthyophthirius multifiliis TaxID=5932 RepID=G0QKG9_ICHMU|nr:hypothetical protein IMG5_017660 [Ichthyophthirius multifiliis]EGR34291.1 hypothetical protein IMG5_017660 [Ichthyophthirius multifiliis]|eukprot:XP_004039595.1 hypothetical protein IMG5_017660 [Ichthyophthirius multifiliis]